MNTNEELFEKAFELAKQNLSEINLNNFPKKLSDEENKRLEELNNRIKMLSNKIDSSKSSNLTPDPQWIKEQTEAIREREVIYLDHLFNIHADRSAIELFKELETELGKEIVKQISTIDKRCILIIGKDSSLIKGIAGCIYYIHIKNILKNNGAYKSFYYFGCLGLDENKIDDWLEQKTLNKYPCDDDMPYEEYKKMRKTADKPKESAIEKYKSGSTLFMRGLESAKILKRLAGIVQDEKAGGLLIVSAASRHNVPDEFLELCETILLEPEMQAEPTGYLTFGTKKIKLQTQQIGLWDAVQTPTTVKEILNSVFGCNYKTNSKICDNDRRRFDKAISVFNNNCKSGFKISNKIIMNCDRGTYGINEMFAGKINLT